MVEKILELTGLRSNAGNQCIPTCLFVVLNNQFKSEKRTNVLKITYKKIKKWVDWGHKLHKVRVSFNSGKDKKYFDEIFKGNWNTETFHQELNNYIRDINLRLAVKYVFSANDLKRMINEGQYPMLRINPQYINDSKHSNNPQKVVRGDPGDNEHFIVLHGYKDDTFYVYDCDLIYKKKEKLDNSNKRCQITFTTIIKHTAQIKNVHWFELIDKAKETKIPQY